MAFPAFSQHFLNLVRYLKPKVLPFQKTCHMGQPPPSSPSLQGPGKVHKWSSPPNDKVVFLIFQQNFCNAPEEYGPWGQGQIAPSALPSRRPCLLVMHGTIVLYCLTNNRLVQSDRLTFCTMSGPSWVSMAQPSLSPPLRISTEKKVKFA